MKGESKGITRVELVDATGNMTVTIWDTKPVDANIGDFIVVSKAKVVTFRDSNCLSSSTYSSITVNPAGHPYAADLRVWYTSEYVTTKSYYSSLGPAEGTPLASLSSDASSSANNPLSAPAPASATLE